MSLIDISMDGEGARVLEVSGLLAALLAGCVCQKCGNGDVEEFHKEGGIDDSPILVLHQLQQGDPHSLC